MQSPFKGNFRVTQEFGNDFKLNGRWVYRSMGYRGHMGTDFADVRPWGQPLLYFPVDGYIARKRDDKNRGYGKHIVMHFRWNGLKYRFTFGHLSTFGNYKQGDIVKAGDMLGVLGNTGLSTAPHLHWDCMPLTEDSQPLYPNNGYRGFLDVIKLPRGTYTPKDLENALESYFMPISIPQKTYVDKWNEWLIKNDIISTGNFTEDQIRVVIANYRIANARKKLTPIPS